MKIIKRDTTLVVFTVEGSGTGNDEIAHVLVKGWNKATDEMRGGTVVSTYGNIMAMPEQFPDAMLYLLEGTCSTLRLAGYTVELRNDKDFKNGLPKGLAH